MDDATLAKFDSTGDHQVIVDWIKSNPDSDVSVCDCCGDGEGWCGTPSEHDYKDFGMNGPYAYNGGVPLCM